MKNALQNWSEMRFLKKVVIFSIFFIVLFTIVAIILFVFFQIEMTTLTEKVYDFWGTQVVITCVLKIGDDVVESVKTVMSGLPSNSSSIEPNGSQEEH